MTLGGLSPRGTGTGGWGLDTLSSIKQIWHTNDMRNRVTNQQIHKMIRKIYILKRN